MIPIGDNLECIAYQQALADFPVLSRTIDDRRPVYLDNASSSLIPRQTVDAIAAYYLENGTNIHRGNYYLSEQASELYEQARFRVAQLIGSRGSEIVFVRNTTEGLNLIALGMGLNKNDVVIASTDSHHSNLLPWMHYADTHFVRMDDTGRVDLNHFQDLMRLGSKVVTLTHCSNVSGVYAPLADMIRIAEKTGALIVADIAQSIPHRQFRVDSLNVDFVAFSGHKMLGPTGIGVLYGREKHLQQLKPVYHGGGAVDRVDSSGYQLRRIPHRFEAGTPHIAGAIGLAAAIQYIEKIGYDRLKVHDEEMAKRMVQEARKRDYLEIAGADLTSERGAIISMKLHSCGNLDDISRILSDSYGIMCRTGHMCAQPFVDSLGPGDVLRASAYLYNRRQDITMLFEALDEIYSVVS